MKEFLTAKQLAEKLGCSERTVFSWAKAGMPSIKITVGRLRRFDPEAVERWLLVQQQQPLQRRQPEEQ